MKRILVGVDDSDGARAALRWALDHARTADVPVEAITAIDWLPVTGRADVIPDLTQLDGIRAATAEWLRTFVESAETDADIDVTSRVVQGHPVDMLTDQAQDAELLVVGARGCGPLHRFLLGSVSAGLLQHAPCSMVIVRPTSDPASMERRRVVVGYDGSSDADLALAWAASWARAHEAILSIVCAWQWPSFQGVPIVLGHVDPIHDMKVSVEAAATRTGLPDRQLETHVLKGSPASVLVEQSDGADLLVVGRRGLGGFQELLLGSVGKRCAAHAACSVAVIRG